MVDGVAIGGADLTKDKNWQYTFKNLPKYSNLTGEKINYTIEEQLLEGYTSKITGDMEKGFVVTNTNIETRDISVTKKWVGKEGESANIRLLANGREIDSKKLTSSDNWKHTFSNLQKYDQKTGQEIKYTIKEDSVNGYNSTITGNVDNGFVVTNTITGKVSIGVTKEWVGPESKEVTVNLLADGKQIESTILNEENNWQYRFTNLEKYKDGKEIEYTIEEVEIEGYDSEISGNIENGFVITNINTETINIPVSKKWIGKQGKSVTIKLLADGVEVDSIKLTSNDKWEYTFENLYKYNQITGQEIQYTVEEEALDGYKSEISGNIENGFVVTNTNIETRDISVTKNWVGKEGESATIRLLADGVEVDSIKLTNNNNWKHKFENLYKYNQITGQKINYTIIEDNITGYNSTITGNADNGFVVTNTEVLGNKVENNTNNKPSNKNNNNNNNNNNNIKRVPKTGNERGVIYIILATIAIIIGSIILIKKYKYNFTNK